MHRHRLRLALAGMLFAGSVAAQPSGAVDDEFVYRVRQGDTLLGLATTYTGRAELWTTLQSRNAVADPLRLAIGREIRIPFSLIPEQPATVAVTHVSGPAQAGGRSLAPQATLQEGQVVSTGPSGSATLELADGSKLTLPPASQVTLDRVRTFQGTGLTDSIIQLQQGSVESAVAPRGDGVGRFEVRTPVTVTGVRGTRLRVHASDSGVRSEVVEGRSRLAIRPPGTAGQTVRIARNQGAAVSAEGALLGVRALLPAPRIESLERESGQWALTFEPVANAAAYLVRVASDPEGSMLASSATVTQPRAKVSAPGAGTYYVIVRAMDAIGLGGADAARSFQGMRTLVWSSGLAVGLGSGGSVLLGDY